MIKSFRQYSNHLSVLALLLIAIFALFVGYSRTRQIQTILTWTVALIYLGWGIIHHHIRRDLTRFIVLEYLMVAILAGVVVQTVINTR